MFQPIYQISLEGRTIKIDKDTWYIIHNKLFENKWFYVIYQGKKYKYVDKQSYYERPAKYKFDLVLPWDNEEIEYIYVEEAE